MVYVYVLYTPYKHIPDYLLINIYAQWNVSSIPGARNASQWVSWSIFLQFSKYALMVPSSINHSIFSSAGSQPLSHLGFSLDDIFHFIIAEPLYGRGHRVACFECSMIIFTARRKREKKVMSQTTECNKRRIMYPDFPPPGYSPTTINALCAVSLSPRAASYPGYLPYLYF